LGERRFVVFPFFNVFALAYQQQFTEESKADQFQRQEENGDDPNGF